MELYQVKATLNGQTLVVGYGKTYYMALKDCESQFDIIPHVSKDDLIMHVKAPDGSLVSIMSLAETKAFNF